MSSVLSVAKEKEQHTQCRGPSLRSVASRRFRSRAAREAGFNLIEILIALAIFGIGVVQVMAMFPAAVISGADTVRGTYALVIGRSAIAELEFQLRTPMFIGKIADAPDPPGNPLNVWKWEEGAMAQTGWTADEWKGCFVTLTNRSAADGRIQSCYIEHNGATDSTPGPSTLEYTPDDNGGFDEAPRIGDMLKITRSALPKVASDGPSRRCKVGNGAGLTDDELAVETLDNWDPSGWAPNVGPPARYFVIMTSGYGSRKAYLIKVAEAVAANKLKLTCPNADFQADGIVAGDTLFIAGSPEFKKWQPCPNFGVATIAAAAPEKDRESELAFLQTLQPLWYRERYSGDPNSADHELSAFTYATLISDVRDLARPDDLVRVDVLVYQRYNNRQFVDKNLRAVGHYTTYLSRR